jgi:hypothetical protein
MFSKEDVRMDEIQEYFLCDGCSNKEFKRIYSFSLRFHGVNFSDGLIYDQLTDEVYQCTKCQKTFTKKEIEEGLVQIKRRRKRL